MKPIKIYIDTNSLNDIAPRDKHWEKTQLGKYLLDNSVNRNIEVWASPANVLEIALNKDLDHRNNMAKALNTLIMGQRMMPSVEFQIIDDFLELIEHVWSSSTKKNRLEFLKANSARNYIALIGQLCALKEYDCSNGFAGIIAPKLATQIIHDEIFENPIEELEKRIEAIQNKKYSHLNYLNPLKNLGLEELYAKKEELESQKHEVNKRAVQFLQKNTQLLINGYALDDLSFACDQTFVYSEDLHSTIIDFEKIVSQWDNKNPKESNKGINVKPLKTDLTSRFTKKLQTIQDCRNVLKALVERFHTQVRLPQISNYILVKDLEKGLNKGEIPTGGVILDSQHSIASLYCNILLSRDQRLNASVGYWYKTITKDKNLFRETCKNLKELKRTVEKGLKK